MNWITPSKRPLVKQANVVVSSLATRNLQVPLVCGPQVWGKFSTKLDIQQIVGVGR